MIKIFGYRQNNYTFFFVQYAHIPKCVLFSKKFTIYESCESRNIECIDRLIATYILKHEPRGCIIFYSRQITLKHSFSCGIEINVEMAVVERYHRNINDFIIQTIFVKAFKPHMQIKLGSQCTEAYITSLCKFFLDEVKFNRYNPEYKIMNTFLNNLSYDKSLFNYEHVKAEFEEYWPEYKYLLNQLNNDIRENILLVFYLLQHMTPKQTAKIRRVISQNTLSQSVSPNVFNLSKNEPMQQNSLNVKKIETKNFNEDDTYVRLLDINSHDSLKNIIGSGRTYWPFDMHKYVFIKMYIPSDKLKIFLERNIFTLLNIISIKINTYHIKAAIYQPFYEKKFPFIEIEKKIINYKIIHPNADEFSNIKCFSMLTQGTKYWQYVNSRVLGINNTSEEILMSSSRTFEMYAVVSLEALFQILNETDSSVYISHMVNHKNIFYYYYARFTICRSHVHRILTQVVPTLCNRDNNNSIKMSADSSIFDILWYRRPPMCLIYHTYFEWFYEASKEQYSNYNNETIKRNIIDLAIMNIVNYKFIIETGNISTVNINVQDGIVYMRILIEALRNMARDCGVSEDFVDGDCKLYKKLKFSPFIGVEDGMLTSSVSIRSCDTAAKLLQKPKSERKKFKAINSTNVSMLLNIPDYSGVQNPKNSFTL